MESSAGSRGWQLESQDLFANTHRGIALDSQTCLNCHGDAGETFDLIFKKAGYHDDPDGVAAYGTMQGYDGVLSAPWFSREALDGYGKRRATFAQRPEWAKFFENYNASEHSAQLYRRFDHLSATTNPLRGQDVQFNQYNQMVSR